MVGLIDAIGDNFPAVHRIVGEDFFRAMARAYAMAETASLAGAPRLWRKFPDFIAAFEPAASLPYLADVARIERAWSEAYHATEAKPLSVEAFSARARDDSAGLRLVPHPSLRVVRSRFPAVTIWRMNVADGVAGPVDFTSDGEDAVVLRPEAEVEARVVSPDGAAFVGALAARRTLAEAAEAAFRANDRFDLPGHLAALIAMGAFVDVETADEPGAWVS